MTFVEKLMELSLTLRGEHPIKKIILSKDAFESLKFEVHQKYPYARKEAREAKMPFTLICMGIPIEEEKFTSDPAQTDPSHL